MKILEQALIQAGVERPTLDQVATNKECASRKERRAAKAAQRKALESKRYEASELARQEQREYHGYQNSRKR